MLTEGLNIAFAGVYENDEALPWLETGFELFYHYTFCCLLTAQKPSFQRERGGGNISVTEREAAFNSTDRENQGRNGSLTTLAYNLAMMNNFLKVH